MPSGKLGALDVDCEVTETEREFEVWAKRVYQYCAADQDHYAVPVARNPCCRSVNWSPFTTFRRPFGR